MSDDDIAVQQEKKEMSEAAEDCGEVEPKKPRLLRSAVVVTTNNLQNSLSQESTGTEGQGSAARVVDGLNNEHKQQPPPTLSPAAEEGQQVEEDRNLLPVIPPPPLSPVNTVEEQRMLTRGTAPMHPYSDRAIQVGPDHQARIPTEMATAAPDSLLERSVCMWTPDGGVDDSVLEEFCEIARVQYNYNLEQSLGMLHYDGYNVEKALADLYNFCPTKSNWSTEDKVLFEQAFSFHGKNFARIQQLLPHKQMQSLVEYYYSWKKTRNFTSYLDNQEESSDSDSSSNDERSNDSKKEDKKACGNCGYQTTKRSLNLTPVGQLCNACNLYWKRTGGMRPCKKKLENAEGNEKKKGTKCPKGFNLAVEQLKKFMKPNPELENVNSTATSSEQQGQGTYKRPATKGEAYLRGLDRRIYGLKAKAAKNSQFLEDVEIRNGLDKGINQYRIPKHQKLKTSYRWTERDKMLAAQAFRKYGKNFQAISEVLETKTAEAVKNFWREYRTRFGLDLLIEEFEKEKEMKLKQMKALESSKAAEIAECIEIVDDDDDKVSGQPPTTGITEEVAGEKVTSEG